MFCWLTRSLLWRARHGRHPEAFCSSGRQSDALDTRERTGAVVEADLDIRHAAAGVLDVEGR